MFDYIKKMAENNDHTGAYIEGCELVGLTDLATELKALDDKHLEIGYLTEELSSKRRSIYQEMIRKARPLLGDMFEEFRASF